MHITRTLQLAIRSLAVAGVAAVALVGPMSHPGAAAETCHKWVATAGSDVNDGSAARPYRSLAKLASALTAGQTGCLPGGQTYQAIDGNGIVRTTSSTATAPITIRSGAGGRARISGLVEVRPTGHDIVFTDLDFVGTPADANGAPMYPKSTHINIDGDRVKLVGNDITNPFGVCIDVGAINAFSKTYSGERADDIVITANRVHGCGMSTKITFATSESGAHGIYLVNTLNARVTENLVYSNRYRGLQTWPKAEGSLIANNLFDANATHVNIGSALGDGYPWYSSNNTVRDNIMSNRVTNWRTSQNPSQVYGYFPAGSPDYGNDVFGNCLAGNDAGITGNGLKAHDNTVGDAKYADRVNANFRLTAGSACTGKGPASVQPGAPTKDTTAPTLVSVEVPATTTTRTITIKLSANDNVGVTQMRFANEDGTWSAWQPFATSTSWTLSSSAAAYKGVSTQVRDAAFNQSTVIFRKVTCNSPCS